MMCEYCEEGKMIPNVYPNNEDDDGASIEFDSYHEFRMKNKRRVLTKIPSYILSTNINYYNGMGMLIFRSNVPIDYCPKCSKPLSEKAIQMFKEGKDIFGRKLGAE